MTVKPVKISIGGLLNEYQRLPLKLPEFQRSFSWENAQVATFWGDLKAFSDRWKTSKASEYFFGPVVLIESKTEITVLDGQQRLATSIIFLAALRSIATAMYKSAPNAELHDFSRLFSVRAAETLKI